MPRVQVGTDLHCSRELAFELVSNYSRRLSWDSLSRRARADGVAVTLVMAIFRFAHILNIGRVCFDHLPVLSPVIVSDVMLNGPAYLAKLTVNWRFNAVARQSDCCSVVLEYQYVSAWPHVDKVINPLIVHFLETTGKRTLQDFKQAIEKRDKLALPASN